jgi:CBS-domain-containing membrane protein
MNAPALPTFRFPAQTCIAQAQPQVARSVTLDSPGLDVMTDLTMVKAATIEPTTSLDSAERMMIHQGVRLLFVVSDFPCVEGLVTAGDLMGDKPMRRVTERQVRRQDLCVADVMTELAALDALDYDELKTAKVERVISTFKKFGRHHLLVVQAATKESAARIRGVLSVTQLERQLGQAILTAEIATTFAEIERALA